MRVHTLITKQCFFIKNPLCSRIRDSHGLVQIIYLSQNPCRYANRMPFRVLIQVDECLRIGFFPEDSGIVDSFIFRYRNLG